MERIRAGRLRGVALAALVLLAPVVLGATALTRWRSESQARRIAPADVRKAPGGTLLAALPDDPGTGLINRGHLQLRSGSPRLLRVAGNGPFGVRLEVEQADPTDFWRAQAYLAYPKSLRKGESLLLRLRARSVTGNPCWLLMEQSQPPYSKDVARHLSLGPTWHDYVLRFDAQRDYAPGEARIRLQMGEQKGQAEVADLDLYAGQKPARP